MVFWPDDPYGTARGSFERSVPIPLHGPLSGSQKAVFVACDWLPYIRGALMQLGLQATWQDAGPGTLDQAQRWALQLIESFPECVGSPAVSCPFDFENILGDNGGFTNLDESPFTPNFIGTFIQFLGWQATSAAFAGTTEVGVTIFKSLSAPLTVNFAQMVYNIAKGSFSHGTSITRNALILSLGGVQQAIAFVYSDVDTDGDNKVLEIHGSVTFDRVDLRVHSSWQNGSSEPFGNASIIQWNYNIVSGACA